MSTQIVIKKSNGDLYRLIEGNHYTHRETVKLLEGVDWAEYSEFEDGDSLPSHVDEDIVFEGDLVIDHANQYMPSQIPAAEFRALPDCYLDEEKDGELVWLEGVRKEQNVQ
jgi:hypothetical protein